MAQICFVCLTRLNLIHHVKFGQVSYHTGKTGIFWYGAPVDSIAIRKMYYYEIFINLNIRANIIKNIIINNKLPFIFLHKKTGMCLAKVFFCKRIEG